MDEELRKKIEQAQSGNKEILNKLVEENYGLIKAISKRFINRGYDMEDITQIGAIGLIKAIKKFDFSYNVTLSTFAVAYIIGEIKRFLRDDSIEELSKKLKATKEDIILAIDSSNSVESLEGKTEEDGTSLLEKLCSNENNEEKIVNNLTLKQCIENLEPRQKEIIYLRYFKCQTQKKVAEIIGISQVQVSRIEKQILKNMGEELKEA